MYEVLIVAGALALGIGALAVGMRVEKRSTDSMTESERREYDINRQI